ERRFADKKAEQPINVLVCTPTMEMGIDIGDLSTVFLSDVPPGIANRVQRVGRAGRSTGTALISQLFRDTPHDQYFWQTPRELLQGRVETPVCRLDAPEVLKRHLRAYLLDCWIRDHPLAEIPATVSRLLSDADMNGFPPLWFAFVEQNKEGLWKGFASLLADDLRRDSLEKVKDFFFSGTWKEEIETLLRRREQEIRDAQLHLRRINERLKQPALQVGNGETDPERKELFRVRAQARRHLKALTGEHTLEWWTVEGLLPNYTFPDREVILRRFLPRADEDLETEEFARAPEMALRDFAPGNTFYARGHASTVNQIPMVSREVEEWRFCPECHHMERAEEKAAGACPRCGNAVWQDQGQVHPMVRITHVMSRVRSSEDVSIRDQQDERERQPTEVLPFFHFPDDPLIGCGVKGQVFGFEFFESTLMREINFGPKNEEQTRRTVANQSVPLKGFTICTKCGAAAEKNKKGDWSIRHVRGFGCDRNDRRTDVVQQMTAVGTNEERVNNAGYEQGIYLYRELRSEALRVLLPVSDALCKERVATWEAVLRLGLREKIGGSERQIGIAAYDEPIREQNRTLRARYLVLYDKIPGGTGYLRQLADEREFQDLLSKALAKIRNCSCQHDGSKDGCYRCLFRYESQHAHEHISRRMALEMVEPLLEKKENWERKVRLQVQEMDARRLLMESDLEATAEEQLLKGLEERLTHSTLSVEEYQRGDRQGLELTWPLNQGRAGWRMIRQVTLSGEDGVPFTTRADWVLEPIFESGTGYDNEKIKPVVFYCDGAEFHIGEGEFYRLSKDILIREGLRRGNKYAVFSVTWRDLKESESSSFGNMAAEMDPEEDFIERLRRVADVTGGAVDPVKLWRSSSLDLLVEYLMDPRRERWVELAKQVSYAAADVFHKKEHAAPLTSVVKGLDAGLVAEAKVTYLPDRRFLSPKEKPMVFRELHFGPGLFLTLLVTTRPKKVLMDSYTEGVLRLEDTRREDSDSMVKEQFQTAWHAFHHWFNVLQWLEPFRFVTGESLASKSDDWALLEQMYPVDGLKAKLQAAKKEPVEPKPKVDLTWVEYVHSTYRSVAAGLAKAGVPVPEVGYEFMEEDRIVGEAELAWPEHKLCVLRKPQRIDAPAIRKQGWKIWDLSLYENEKDEPVKPEGTWWKELWQAELERGM
ncbi:DEAD/DEAH box helicase domain protein, partial [Desmospora sp. 8437]